MKRALVSCIGSLALLSGVVAGCNNLIAADPPSLLRDVGGTGGVGGVGGRSKVGQAGTTEDAGEGGTIAAEGGDSGAPSAHGGTSGSAVGGGSSGAGEGGVSGSGAAGGATGGAASGASGGGAGGAARGVGGAGPCTTPACMKPPGAHCSATEECQTGVCGAESVCCNVTCSNACTTCASPAKPGVCSAIDYSSSADVANCGACGTECSTSHITPACTAGKCGGACVSGYAHCSSADNVGCEVNTTADAANCGGCGNKCKYGVCSGSACVSTVWGLTAHQGSGQSFGMNSAGAITAVPLTLAFDGKLAAIGLRAYPPSTTVHMYLALYTSAGTVPTPQLLLAQTAELTMGDVTSGAVTEGLIASHPSIPAGDYFVVIMSDNLFHMQDELAMHTIWLSTAPVTYAPLVGGFPGGANMKTLSIPAPDAYIVTAP